MQADTACWLMTNDFSEDVSSEDESSEDESGEDESGEDESGEDESSEDENSDEENSGDESSEVEISEDESSDDEYNDDEDLISEMSQRREDYNSLHLRESVSTNEDQIAVELVLMGSKFADHLTDDEDSTENSTASGSDDEVTTMEDSTVASFSEGESQGVETTRSSSSEFSAIEDDIEYVTLIDELNEHGDWLDEDRQDEESRKGFYRYHRECPEDDAPFEEEVSVELVLRSRNLSFANYFFSPSRDVHDVTEIRDALGQPLLQQGQVEGKAVRFKAVVSENTSVTNEHHENLILPLPEEGNNIVFEEQQVKRPKAEKIVNPEEENVFGKKDERLLTKLNPRKNRIMSLFKRKSTRAERDGASTAAACHGLRSFRSTRASE